MNENTAGIDPRFDPRFQRGYVPDAAAAMSAPVPPLRAPTVSASAPNADSAASDDPAAAILGLLAHAQAEQLARTGHERDDADAVDDERVEPDSPAFTWAVEPQLRPQLQPQLDAGPVVDASPARWFWIALAACILFVVVGVALFWNGASDRTTFMTAPSGVEGVFYQYSMMLAPALVQAGTIGAVAVLVMWAIRGRRTAGAVE
jgi:hypothetical protein